MTERFLQFIWQHQLFNCNELKTVNGETIQVIDPGILNTHQGPDFSFAKIRINDTMWVGAVELHLKTSGWEAHAHEADSNYKQVILHVVEEDDMKINDIPVLELSGRIPGLMLERYRSWMLEKKFIPCEKNLAVADFDLPESFLHSLLEQRLVGKARLFQQRLDQTKSHWDEACWWWLMRNFGMPVNTEVFESIARSLPLKLMSRHSTQINQLECLLFGQAGILDGEFTDQYPQMLKKEFEYLRRKYSLQSLHKKVDFLRMRPSNFPTIRLAQMAVLLTKGTNFFDRIISSDIFQLTAWLDVAANDYWQYHFVFDEASNFGHKKPGLTMIHNVITNTVGPVLYAWGVFKSDTSFVERSKQLLYSLPAESNTITRSFSNFGIRARSAAESQALIQLKHEWCDKKKCLDCEIGRRLLR